MFGGGGFSGGGFGGFPGGGMGGGATHINIDPSVLFNMMNGGARGGGGGYQFPF